MILSQVNKKLTDFFEFTASTVKKRNSRLLNKIFINFMVKLRSKKNFEVLMSALVIKKQLSVLYFTCIFTSIGIAIK